MSGSIGTTTSKSHVIGRPVDNVKAWGWHDPDTDSDPSVSFNVYSISELSNGMTKVWFAETMSNSKYVVCTGTNASASDPQTGHWGEVEDSNYTVFNQTTEHFTMVSYDAGYQTMHSVWYMVAGD